MSTTPQNLDVYRELLDQVGTGASAGGMVAQSAFTQFFCEFLTEKAHFVTDLTPTYFAKKWKTANVRVDAYYLDEQTHDLTLAVSDFSSAAEPETIGLVDSKTAFEQVRRFYRCCGSKDFRQGLEDSDEVRPLVQLIAENLHQITRVRYVLMTNKTLGSRVKDDAFDDLKKSETIASEYTVWDFYRYAECVTSAVPIAEIEVDCKAHSPDGKGLPFLTSPDAGLLPGANGQREYSAYLLMVPGQCVYDWYAKYADRLLEQNVRTFLQFKGKVNRGIRGTIQTEPHRFLAYNNGLTATADEIELDKTKTRIVRIKNLQIVNGGQTTASIYTAFNTLEANLSAIAVQMKLIVASGAHVEDLVGKISRFANSQNKIKDTDLASNQRFMLRMESFSRRLTANPGGTLHGTRWFFERTRGQYANAINVLKTEAERTKFKKLYPKDQVFTKSDLAKYILSWDWSPWIVAKGAEKAFVVFQNERKFGSDADFLPGQEHVEQWRFKDADGNPQFCEYYYKELIGKAILFRSLDKLLRTCDWCKGYKSQIVTYTLSVFHRTVYKNHLVFNFIPIWGEQLVPTLIADYLVGIAREVNDILVTSANGKNVAEWAKSPEFWVVLKSRFKDTDLPKVPQCFLPAELIKKAREQSVERQTLENEKTFLQLVMAVEDGLFDELKKWIASNPKALRVSGAQEEALRTRVFSKKYMTPKLSRKLILLWQQAHKAGFQFPPPSEVE